MNVLRPFVRLTCWRFKKPEFDSPNLVLKFAIFEDKKVGIGLLKILSTEPNYHADDVGAFDSDKFSIVGKMSIVKMTPHPFSDTTRANLHSFCLNDAGATFLKRSRFAKKPV